MIKYIAGKSSEKKRKEKVEQYGVQSSNRYLVEVLCHCDLKHIYIYTSPNVHFMEITWDINKKKYSLKSIPSRKRAFRFAFIIINKIWRRALKRRKENRENMHQLKRYQTEVIDINRVWHLVLWITRLYRFWFRF